jgi:hypothetical protein
MVEISWLGRPNRWMKYNLKNFSSLLHFIAPPFLVNLRADQTAQPVCMHDDSNDAVCCKEIHFEDRIAMKLNFEVKTCQQTRKLGNPNAKFPAKSKHSNNFCTVRARRKTSTDCLYDIGVEISNGDVISAAGCFLGNIVAKTTSDPF